MSAVPILYSFRRCPYAMRARMALWISRTSVELREVVLADKPEEMLDASPKATVPVLQLPDGSVVDESIDIMRWALHRADPEKWLERDDPTLLALVDGPFKHHLDRYKYYTRHDTDPREHRSAGLDILHQLSGRLEAQDNLCGDDRGLCDIATFPFIRQFANHDREWFDSAAPAALKAWLDRHLSSDLFAAVMAKHDQWRAGDPPVLFGPEG